MKPEEFALNKLVNWVKSDALPFWAKFGLNASGGGYEALLPDGTPDLKSPRRVRVEARQAYAFAHCAYLGWHKDAANCSRHFWDMLITKGMAGGTAKLENGYRGCAHMMNPDGSLQDDLRDTYAQAFVMLSAAWQYRLYDDENALEIAKNALQYLDQFMGAQNGGWYEGFPASLPRRQNPHMHLFEALMTLYDVTEDIYFLNRAHDVFTLFRQKFYCHKSGAILEFFDNDWQKLDGDGGPIEPGHMMEWSWLLYQFSKRSGIHTQTYQNGLFSAALSIGLNSTTGLLFDKVTADGKTISATSRNWAQLEFLKACIAQALGGNTDAVARIPKLVDAIFTSYLETAPPGGWMDQVDKDGQVISKTMPASTFYHWVCACAEADAYIRTVTASRAA